MPRYWLYLNSKVQGPYEIPNLRKVPGFTLLTQVCAENESSWRMADDVIDIKSYFLTPPRASSVVLDSGNAAAISQPFIDRAPPDLSIVEPGTTGNQSSTPLVVSGDLEAKESAGVPSLRQLCEMCGYKNPRDVAACMKCGTPLQNKEASPASSAAEEVTATIPIMSPVVETPTVSPAPAVSSSNAMVEIPVTRILILLTIVSVIAGASFMGYRFWQSRHRPMVSRQTLSASPAPTIPSRSKSAAASRGSSAHRAKASVARLPGVRPTNTPPKVVSALSHGEGTPAESAEENASYKVISEATPLQRRHSAPLDSTYAIKRRGDRGLWTGQEDQAIQQTQRYRIYGGQRTLLRNAEILMQILRDREYNTAFENGKRIYLYNDMDWSATQKEGPLYEVRLTFSGGKESDGTPRKPLRFAFDADLERGSLDPSGEDQLHSNTMHAFFDESRIPPEERRPIAKDTEELVLAAQPDASPLALDTVARRFVSTYSTGAMARVAGAFNLDLVNKKLVHDPRITSQAPAPARSEITPSVITPPKPKPTVPLAKETVATTSKSGAISYQMESLGGRERRLILQAPSQASPGKIWEIMTGYDRLKQFAPDMLVSEREGQDGSAVIVHMVSLTRFLFFVFKVNIHLRIIEHPQQHSLEFERIAGEFESFRGSIQIEPNGKNGSTIHYRATLVPKGRVPDWVLRDMTRRFLVPVIDAVRSRAESL